MASSAPPPSQSETDRPRRILAIAGSDSGGGAGIQADIKTITVLGGYAASAVTAITAQDTRGVHGVWPLSPDAVARQIQVVLNDIGSDGIKTGMLPSAGVVEAVAETLDETARTCPRIIDPVMVATSGTRLLDTAARRALSSLLIPGATLVTPNGPEATMLTGRDVNTVDDQHRAADRLLEQGALAALVKGGHLDGTRVTDVLHTQAGEWQFSGPRIETHSTHGTGCTLASAITTHLAQGHDLPEAVERARDYVRGALEAAPGLGAGHGPLGHGWVLRR